MGQAHVRSDVRSDLSDTTVLDRRVGRSLHVNPAVDAVCEAYRPRFVSALWARLASNRTDFLKSTSLAKRDLFPSWSIKWRVCLCMISICGLPLHNTLCQECTRIFTAAI